MMFLPARQNGKTCLPAGVVWVAIYSIHPRRKSMSCHPRVTEWTQTIQAHMPHLSKPQATVLALWSLGMVLARSCRSEEHTSELQSPDHLVCRLLLEKKR